MGSFHFSHERLKFHFVNIDVKLFNLDLLLKVYAGFRRLKSGEVPTSVISTTSDCVGSQICEGISEQRTTEHVNYFNVIGFIETNARPSIGVSLFQPYPFCYLTSFRLDVWIQEKLPYFN